MDNQKLLGCPFCGSSVISPSEVYRHSDDADYLCTSCGAQAPKDQWNTRSLISGEYVRGIEDAAKRAFEAVQTIEDQYSVLQRAACVAASIRSLILDSREAEKWQCSSCGAKLLAGDVDGVSGHCRMGDDGHGNPEQVHCGPCYPVPDSRKQCEEDGWCERRCHGAKVYHDQSCVHCAAGGPPDPSSASVITVPGEGK